MKIIVAGGSGQLGSILCKHLSDRAHEVVLLSRTQGPGRVQWDARTVGDWKAVLEGADAVINLCGTPVVKRWSSKNWSEISTSRLESTRAIGQAIVACQSPPKVWVNASAVGYYGDSGEREVVEATRSGSSKLAELCEEWESECLNAETPQTRKVCARIGVVIGPSLRITQMMSQAAKMFVCAGMGTGKQYMSWIHWLDFVRMIEWCLIELVSGAVNVTAPRPVTNGQMAAAFRDVFCRPPVPSIPTPFVRAFAGLAGMEAELILTGQRVIPEIALARGFKFEFPNLDEALQDVLNQSPEAWRSAPKRPAHR